MKKKLLFVSAFFLLLLFNKAISQTTDTTLATEKCILQTSQYFDSIAKKTVNYFAASKSRTFILPLVAYNAYDELMIGGTIFSNPVTVTNHSYMLAPFYSFFSNSFNYFSYWTYMVPIPSERFTYELQLSTRHFSYLKYKDSNLFFSTMNLGFETKSYELKKLKFLSISYSLNLVARDALVWNFSDSTYDTKLKKYYINSLKLKLSNEKEAYNYDFEFLIEQAKNILKLSYVNRYFFPFNYEDKQTGIYLRHFIGLFALKPEASENDLRFTLTGLYGINDYTFSLPFVARSHSPSSFLGAQIYEQDGFFKTPTVIGQTWDWLTAINIKSDIHKCLPFQAFVDLATYKGAGKLYPGNKPIAWETGLALILWKNKIELYFPLMYSSDIKDNLKLLDVPFYKRFSFMLNIKDMNVFKLSEDYGK